ncbi:hypothetical protein AB4090_13485 [Acidithiobacillus sp. IBUN Pt1247-S3]|uniref:hypothetical protein n=1 Tax=Acidithiobacillus sp. IBUN Pt1247-S3 TaxID=3166642 RepID=UPI0034E58832
MNKKTLYGIFLSQGFWTFIGVIITAGCTIYPLYKSNETEVSGELVVQPVLATPLIPSAKLNPELSRHINLKYMNNKVNPSHLQILVYNIENESHRIITPNDFYNPIKIVALGGRKIINATINPESNRPQIIPNVVNESEVVIPPTLLNPRDSISVTIVMISKHKVPIISDPYSNNESSLRWTAAIKGENLVLYRPKGPSKTLEKLDLSVYIYHSGYAVIALFLLGSLLSFAQIFRFFISKYVYKKFIFSSLELTLRVASSWAASESIVSLFDMPNEATIGYLSIVSFVFLIISPSFISIWHFILKKISDNTQPKK